MLDSLFGKRGASVGSAILGNFDQVERAIIEMEGAFGAADKEMEIVEDSITFKLNALKQTWVGLLQELIDRGDLGELIDNLTTISEALAEIIKQIGLMPSLAVLGTAIFGITKPKEFIDTLNSIVNVISKAKALKNVGEIADGVYKVTNAVESIGEVSKGINEATVTVKAAGNIAEEIYGVSNAVEVAGEAASEGSVGFSGLAGSLASIPPVAWGVVIALAAVGTAVYKTNQANENLKKSAKQFSKAYNTSVEDINSYKSKVSELIEKLNDTNISYEDAKNIRIELMDIQDELIKKYGTEAESIDAIGKAINGNIEYFEKLKDVQWQQTITDFNGQNLEGWDTMNRFVHGVKTNSELAVKEMENGYVHFEVGSVDVAEAKKIAEIYGDTFNPEAKEYFINTDNLEDTYIRLLRIREEVSKTGKSWTNLDKVINDTKDKIDSYSEFYKQYVLNERILGTQYEENLVKIQGIYEDYIDAITDNDEERINNSKNSLIEAYNEFNDKLFNDDLLSDVDKHSIEKYINSVTPLIQSDLNKNKLTAFLQTQIVDENGNPVGVNELKNNLKKAINSEDGLEAYITVSPDISKDSKNNLKKQNKALQEEYAKIKDPEFGLGKFEQRIKDQTLPTKYGNVDMDDRPEIQWNEELIKKYSKQLHSWFKYKPKVGDVDTVLGGSNAFNIGEKEIEIAYTPIIDISKNKNTKEAALLTRKQLNDYINEILSDVYAEKGENWTIQDILDRDQIGKFSTQLNGMIRNVIAGTDGYIYNSNSTTQGYKYTAEEIGKLMHFSGKYGAIQLAEGFNETITTEEWIDENQVKTKADEIADIIKSFENEEELLRYEDVNYDKDALAKHSNYTTLQKLAEEYGVTVADLITLVRQLKSEEMSGFGWGSINDNTKKNIGAYYGSSGIGKLAEEKVNGALDLLTSKEDYNDVQAFTKDEWNEALKYAKERYHTDNLLLLTEEEISEALKYELENVRAIKQEREEQSKTFTQSAFAEDIAELNNLTALYDKFVEKKKDANDVALDIGDVEGLREKWSGIIDDFDKFEQILTTSTGDKAADIQNIQNAFNEAANAYVAKEVEMKGATAETIAEMQTQLEKVGFTKESVAQYAQYISDLNAAKDLLKAKGYELISITNNEISAIEAEGNVSAGTAQELRLLAIEEQLANGGLDTSASCAELIALAENAGIAAEAIANLKSVMNAQARYEASVKIGGPGSYYAQKEYLNAAKKEADNAKSDLKKAIEDQRKAKLELSLGGKSSGGGGGGGGGGGAADEAEKTKDIMAELSSQLDEIQSKWESLTDILDHYNETGKVTIDQAQELFQTDWKYLALLGDGTGIVQNADEAFQSLAEAKINEMRVQLARNAIDAINGLNDEAEAAKYLSNAYLDLADGALAAEEAILQTALATKLAKGGSIAAAAEMIYKGYQNAKMLTANIDYSKKKDSDKDSDKDKDEKDRDKEQNEKDKKQEETYEKEFNWIETLLERLNKTTEKWTKRAEKFFTFWNKNWAVNKAMNANQEEINAQKQAYQYYKEMADNVRLSQKYKDRVDNGIVLYETVHNPLLGKKIEEYQKWY